MDHPPGSRYRTPVCRICTHKNKKNNTTNICRVRLSYKPYIFSERTVFFLTTNQPTVLLPTAYQPKVPTPSPATDDATIAEYDDVFPDMLPWAGLYLTTKIMFQICLVIILKWPQSFSTEALKRAYVANKNLAFHTGIKPQPPPLIQLSHQILPQVCLCPVNISKQRVFIKAVLAATGTLNYEQTAARARPGPSLFPTHMSYSLQHQHHHSDIMVALQEPEEDPYY